MRELIWFEDGVGSDFFSISQLEKELGIVFPIDYKEFAMKHSGASNPDECEFNFATQNHELNMGNFGSLLSISGDHSESVRGAKNNLGNQLPPHIIPVISTGSGDYICIDCKDATSYQIVYFFHERSGENSLCFIADSISEFLDFLTIPEDL